MNEASNETQSLGSSPDPLTTWLDDQEDDRGLVTHGHFAASLRLDEAEPFTPRPNEAANDPNEFVNTKRTLSPTSVRDFGNESSASKRLKVCSNEEEAVTEARRPLPIPDKRRKGTRPVCTFLNFFGSRVVNLKEATTSTTSLAAATAAAATQSKPMDPQSALMLFPVCTCKLRHQVLKGSLHTAPPILDFFSRVCQPSSLSPPPTDDDSHADELQNHSANIGNAVSDDDEEPSLDEFIDDFLKTQGDEQLNILAF